jgi:O-antigen/teichoic acid export membrane protein
MINIQLIKQQYKSDPNLKKAIKLLLWNFISIPIAIITSMIVTRFLGAKDYGNYTFLSNIFSTAVILFSFGFFQASNRAIVITDDSEKIREYYGATFIILIAISLVAIIFLYAYVFIDHNFIQKGIRQSTLFLIPFVSLSFFLNYYESLLPSDNKINSLIVVRFLPKVLMMILSVVLYYCFASHFTGDKLSLIWTFFFGSQLLIYGLIFIFSIKPSFCHIKERLSDIISFNKTFGFNVYIGNIFSTLVASLTPILISYFVSDNSSVGFYSLALTICSPLALIPRVMGTTYYKSFASQNKLPKKILLLALIVSLAALLFMILIVPLFIKYLYTEEYLPVINLSYIVSIGALLYGFSDLISKYLSARGDGKALRNSSIIVGIATLLGSIFLIPAYKDTGAALTYVSAGIAYLIVIILYYLKNVKINVNNINNQQNG